MTQPSYLVTEKILSNMVTRVWVGHVVTMLDHEWRSLALFPLFLIPIGDFLFSGLKLYHKLMKLVCYQNIKGQIQHYIKQCLEELGNILQKIQAVTIMDVYD